MQRPYKVMLTMPCPTWPLARQSPGESSRWGNFEFIINSPISECDAWIVIEGLLGPQATTCPQGNQLLILLEHEEIRSYNQKFVDQFPAVLTCNNSFSHTNKIKGQLGFSWHAGINRSNNFAKFNYDKFFSQKHTNIHKNKLLSTVCSGKSSTAAHRSRLAISQMLNSLKSPDVQVFGGGFEYIDDKWDAIAPYHYHLVIENGSYQDWWTEKLADAYLGFSVPIYWGCPNLSDYFPQDSYIPISIDDPAKSVERVIEIIKTPPSEKQVSSVIQARSLLLDKYNIYPMLADLVSKMPFGERKLSTIMPEVCFSNTNNPGIINRIKQVIRQKLATL